MEKISGTVIPARSSITLSVSVKVHPSLRASSLPTLVFPEHMNPPMKMLSRPVS